MQWIARRVMNVLMGAFVGTGLGIDEDGRLCLPDGLGPEHVKRFIELCTLERYPHPRAAMHDLFSKVGVAPDLVDLLDRIIREDGDLDLGAVTRHGVALTAALPRFQQIPERFRAFLVDDLAIAEPQAGGLEKAVASARHEASRRLGCAADWDAILRHPEAIGRLAAPWRASLG